MPGDVADVAVEPLAVARPRVIIGIDLGTTNTCASHVVDGRPTIIRGRTGTNTIPSMVTFDPDGTCHVGQRAADRRILYPLRTVYGSKRLLGRTYRSNLAAELQKHFAYPLAEADGQRFGVRVDDRVISMNAIATRVLEEVRSTAEAQLGVTVDAAVITVPAYFSEVQREAVRRAARDAKLTVHRIVNEPTAAAVAYGHKQKGKVARVAVWDFGGGTFDFSVVDVADGQLEVVATGGDNFVGGSDFDDLLASHLLAEFQRAEGLDVDPEPQQIARLREAAEVAKLALSIETEYLVELPEFTREPKRALRVLVTRKEFDDLTAPLIQRTIGIAVKVMTSQSMAPTAVDDVLLVGGTTRSPPCSARWPSSSSDDRANGSTLTRRSPSGPPSSPTRLARRTRRRSSTSCRSASATGPPASASFRSSPGTAASRPSATSRWRPICSAPWRCPSSRGSRPT